MVTLEQLIEDGHIFIGTKEKKGKMTTLTLTEYGETVIVKIAPGASEKRISIPTEEDLKLYLLLKDEKAEIDKFFDVRKLREKLKDSVSDDFNIIESLERMRALIDIKDGGSRESTSLIASTRHRKYKDTGKEEIEVSFT